MPVVKLGKNRDEQRKGSSGEQVVRERTNVEKASLTKLVGELREEYADLGKGVQTYQSKATKGSNQLGEGSAE